MSCPLCQNRPAKRPCPALGRKICTVCCGTKRLVEIRCPSDCGFLASARQHPPAVEKRQQERDVTLLMPAIAELSDRQSRFFFLFQSIVARQTGDPLRPLIDADVAEAAASRARTLDTASRGLIYEQAPQSLPAQELASALGRAFDEVAAELKGPRSPLERDAAHALEALAEAARKVGPLAGRDRQGFLELARRLLKPTGPDGAAATEPEGNAGPLIIP